MGICAYYIYTYNMRIYGYIRVWAYIRMYGYIYIYIYMDMFLLRCYAMLCCAILYSTVYDLIRYETICFCFMSKCDPMLDETSGYDTTRYDTIPYDTMAPYLAQLGSGHGPLRVMVYQSVNRPHKQCFFSSQLIRPTSIQSLCLRTRLLATITKHL